MRPLAVLRPEPGASATLARAAALGLEAFSLPLFRIEPLGWRAPEPGHFDALLVTSANAVRQAGAQLAAFAHLPVHAVGDASAAAAGQAGLHVASSGTDGVEALLDSLPAPARLLHLCGEDRVAPSRRHDVTGIPVYRAAPLSDPVGLERLGGAVALVHSPRAGQRLAELVTNRKPVFVVAISRAAAEACGSGWGELRVADEPRDEALLSLAAPLCKQTCPE